MKQNPTLTRVIKRIASKKGVTFEKVYQAMKKSPIHAEFAQPEMVADGLYRIQSMNIRKFSYVAAFDMDHTLSYSERHLYPCLPEDVKILPNRREKLKELLNMGYRLVLFTNQYAKSKAQVAKKLARVQTFLTILDLPMTAFIATSKNEYRKPEIGAWNYFKNNNNVTTAFFCGDALGRHGDWNNSDLEFAKNAGLEIQEPEKLFPPVEVQIQTNKPKMVVFIGMPGCGKSTFYRNYFSDFIRVSRDVLGTKYKVMKKLKHCCENNLNVVVDNTNPSQKSREEFYNLANGYEITVIYFVNNGRGHNATREKPVKDIAYHVYFKNLEPPVKENTPGKIWRVDGMTASLNTI